MKKVFFLLFATISIQSYACGPYVQGTMFQSVFSTFDGIQQDQVFLFRTDHYSDKYKNYGKNYKMYLQDTTTKEKVLLTENKGFARNIDRNEYLAVEATQNLQIGSKYRFIIEINGKQVDYFSSEIYFPVSFQVFEVKNKKTESPSILKISDVKRYQNNANTVKFFTHEAHIYKITINTPGKPSRAYFAQSSQSSLSVYISGLSNDTNISITQVSSNGTLLMTQYFNVEGIKKWNTSQNS